MTATTTTASSRTARFDPRRALLYVIAIIVLLVIVVPLTFSVFGGFRSNAQLAADPVGLPDPWIWDNYQAALTDANFYQQVGSSLVIAFVTTLLVLPAASLAAFVLARYRFRGREAIYILFTLGLLFPVRGGNPSLVHHPPPDRAPQQPPRSRHASGGVRSPSLDRDPPPLLS